jgi:hypothetical protein
MLSLESRAAGAVVTTNLAFLALAIAADWPKWWVNINYEVSPLTWFSSVQLLAIGCVCFGNLALSRLLAERLEQAPRRTQVWAALGAGMFFLALDERFQLHERLREGVLKPNGIGTDLPGIAPGDFVLVLYALAGIALCWLLYRWLGGAARAWLVAAILLGVVATSMDAADLHGESVELVRTEQFIEEILETLTQMSFFAATLLHLFRLGREVRLVPR